MKATIKIWNPSKGNEIVTLSELKERICERRINALTPVAKAARTEISVHTTDKTKQQVAAHYASFEIRIFGYERAIEVFNQGGCQVASLN